MTLHLHFLLTGGRLVVQTNRNKWQAKNIQYQQNTAKECYGHRGASAANSTAVCLFKARKGCRRGGGGFFSCVQALGCRYQNCCASETMGSSALADFGGGDVRCLCFLMYVPRSEGDAASERVHLFIITTAILPSECQIYYYREKKYHPRRLFYF